MNFLRHVEERLNRTVQALHLPPLAMWVLRVFVILDVDKNAAEQARQADVHNRVGVVSWKRLAEECPATVKSMGEIEQTVMTLTDWGLVQVVGQNATDPVVPGAAACVRVRWARPRWITLPEHPMCENTKPCRQCRVAQSCSKHSLLACSRYMYPLPPPPP